MSDTILEVRDLCLNISSGKKVAAILKNVSFDLHSGQRLGIIGNSGAGKSMTMYALTNLLPERTTEITGSIVFNGQHDILKMPKKEKRLLCSEKTAIILQDSMNALNPYRKIYTQLEENILHFHPEEKENVRKRIEEMMAVVGIPADAATLNKYPGQFSGGMRQRIAIAMALESNARILIADEPTTSLDAINQMNLVRFLKKVCEERELALIFISHNPGIVSMLCEDVLVMKSGEVIDCGKTDEVFARQRENFDPAPVNIEGQAAEVMADKVYRNTEASPVLEIRELRKHYVIKHRLGMKPDHVFPAVRGVSFVLRQGETLGLVGESGCGKSTLAKMIVGLLEPDSGEIMYRGKNIGKMSKRKFRQLRPQIQLIQQNPFGSLDPEMKIFDLLSEGIRIHHIRTDGLSVREYLTDILKDCGLQEEFLDRYPHEFSGGQLQRLAIARAIALRPAIVIADEIVSALDVSVQGQILELLMRLKNERGMSVIFISHDLCVVRSISDKIIVMKDGKIIDSGSTEYIFDQSNCSYTLALKDAIVPSPYGQKDKEI